MCTPISRYYKIKNSWGDNWGESGFVRFVRDKNMCGIGDACSFPTGVTNSTPVPPPTPPPAPKTQYAIHGFASGSMPIWEFTVDGDAAADLKNQMICLHGGQYVLEKATYMAPYTYCDFSAHWINARGIAAVGDTFFVGVCP